MKENPPNADSKKPKAQYGDIKQHNRQGKAIRADGVRQSEHEHIRARINIVLQTTDPETGLSPYNSKAYGRSATLTIPRDMALIKTELDLELRDKTKTALEKGQELPEELKKEMSPEADIKRTIQAREIAIETRVNAGDPVDNLQAITDEKIIEAAHYQQGRVFEAGKSQRIPVAYTDADIEQLLQPLDREPSGGERPGIAEPVKGEWQPEFVDAPEPEAVSERASATWEPQVIDAPEVEASAAQPATAGWEPKFADAPEAQTFVPEPGGGITGPSADQATGQPVPVNPLIQPPFEGPSGGRVG